MDAGDVRVLPPEEDVPGASEVEEVVRVLVAEVGLLCRVARTRADVAPLHGDRPEAFPEKVDDVLQKAERATRAVMENRRRAGLGANGEKPVRDLAERLVPARRDEAGARPPERCREPVGGVLPGGKLRRPRADEALCDRVAGVAADPRDHPVLDRHEEAARVRAVAVADGPVNLHFTFARKSSSVRFQASRAHSSRYWVGRESLKKPWGAPR